jgi:apolipoprotein N-acyltransferase
MRDRRKEKRAARLGGEGARGGSEDPPRKTTGGPREGERPPLRRSLSLVLRPYLLAIVSAMLLTLAFPPMEISWLAYLAPAPLLIMALRTRRSRTVFFASGLGGLVFFSLNMYWFWPITKAGAVALIPYLALYWAVFAWGMRKMREVLPVPTTLLAPILWVPLELVRAWMLTGLPWVYLGHTQYENLSLIQIADTLGAYGTSFLVMMTAGLATDLLTHPIYVRKKGAAPISSRSEMGAVPFFQEKGTVPFSQQPEKGTAPFSGRRLSRVLIAMVLLAAAAWTATVAYGVWRLGQDTKHPGPVVASVQTCIPQEVKLEARNRQIQELEVRLLADQLNMTNDALAEAKQKNLKVDLVVWPETMVPGTQNGEFLNADMARRIEDPEGAEVLAYNQKRWRSYWMQISEASRQAGIPILFGAHSVRFEGAIRVPGGGYLIKGPKLNAALLVTPDCQPFTAAHEYDKAHLVPFGEYVPFKQSLPWLYGLLHGFTPYDYDYSLTPGAHDQKPFVLPYNGGEVRFQAPICYEDAMPYRVREMVRSDDPARAKAVDFLVNISNDGWFNGSVELDQHLALCVFRAVENRVPIVRSVNTGISAIIDPEGRIEEVVQKDGRRRYIAGEIVGRLTLDDRAAPYTRIGDAFALACLAAALALVVATIVASRRSRKTPAAAH